MHRGLDRKPLHSDRRGADRGTAQGQVAEARHGNPIAVHIAGNFNDTNGVGSLHSRGGGMRVAQTTKTPETNRIAGSGAEHPDH